jgi:plastocyanin domain-containing protein
MMASTDSSPGIAACSECSGKGKPPITEGQATAQAGVQVVNVKIENGTYVPNKITAKAGMPVQVVFTGPAKDCVGKPKFGSLNKQIDIRKTGTGTIDLGTLSAGTYTFSCGMGANEGSVIVE